MQPMIETGADGAPPDDSVIVQRIADQADEVRFDRDPWADITDTNMEVFLFGDSPRPVDPDVITVNDIQNAVNSDVVIQTREKHIPELTPVETGDRGEIYHLDPALQQFDANGDPIPLDPAEVLQLMQPTQALGPDGLPAVDPVTNGPALKPGLAPSSFVHVNDKFQADFWGKVFDRYWRRSGIDGWYRRALTNSEVKGWLVATYGWNAAEKKHRLRTLQSVRQGYIDCQAETLDEANHAGVDLVIDANEAVQLAPEYAEHIRENASIGMPDRMDGIVSLGRADRDYKRPVVLLRVWFMRNEPFPLSRDEALAAGLVEERPLPPSGDDVFEGVLVEELEDGPVDTAAAKLGQLVEGFAADEDADQGADDSLPDGSGQPAGDVPPAAGAELATAGMPTALFLAGTDEQVIEGKSASWPTRPGIRQVTVIANKKVDDREVEHFDIPMIHFVNRPVPGTPWGIGEPMFLSALQKARNRMLRSMVTYTEHFKNPACAMPESVAAKLEAEYGTAYVDPGVVLRIPDAIWREHGGKIDAFYEPPQLPPGVFQMEAKLGQEINKQAGQPDVRRGELPSAQTSGRAVGMLLETSTEQVAQKAANAADALSRLAKLMHFTHVHRLSVLDLKAIHSKYPEHVIRASQRKARTGEWDIDVDVHAGTAQLIAAKRQEAMQLWQMRDPTTGEPLVGIEATREALKIDHGQERQRWETEMAKVAQQQAAAAAAAGAAGPQDPDAQQQKDDAPPPAGE